jgi:hypothetical protein|tara:strand:- start:341 stop:541 length:201 start_codon:yes stop_codon:yes gene_type:complete
MLVERTSVISGQVNTMSLPITVDQLENYYLKGMLLQDAFPNLSSSQREFIKTGITSKEWDNLFGEE